MDYLKSARLSWMKWKMNTEVKLLMNKWNTVIDRTEQRLLKMVWKSFKNATEKMAQKTF